MPNLKRREFLAASTAAATAPLLAELGALGQLSRAVAADPQIDPSQVRRTPSIEQLIALIHTTGRATCIPVFVKQLEAGLSYHDFLSALFLATIDHGDPHQVAGVYAAHRVSSEAQAEQRLLPLFWALDRVARGFEEQAPQRFKTLEGLPAVNEAAEAFRNPLAMLDPEVAEHAIVALARAHGARRAMPVLWQWAARRVRGTLGHHPIMLANARSALLAARRAGAALSGAGISSERSGSNVCSESRARAEDGVQSAGRLGLQRAESRDHARSIQPLAHWKNR